MGACHQHSTAGCISITACMPQYRAGLEVLLACMLTPGTPVVSRSQLNTKLASTQAREEDASAMK